MKVRPAADHGGASHVELEVSLEPHLAVRALSRARVVPNPRTDRQECDLRQGGAADARIRSVGERLELASEVVTAPDGRQWLIQASRPRFAKAEWQVVIASLAGLAKHREVLPADADAAARVTTLAELVQQGGWPQTRRR